MVTATVNAPDSVFDRYQTAFSSWPKGGGRPAGYFTPSTLAQSGDFYKENGFLVIEDAFSSEEVDALNQETVRICRGELGDIRGWIPSDVSESDEEVISKFLCIHFPHKISELMESTITQKAMVDTLVHAIGPNVKCMQSMLFIKASGKPGQAWHQDEYYIPTRDRSLTGGWIAMDDATLENGCLWIIPGSHRNGILWPQRQHEDRRFDCAGESHQFPYTDEDSVPVEVKAGSIVFFNGYLLHRSLPNKASTGFRRSLVNHYMSAESLLPWQLIHKNPDGSIEANANIGVAQADYRDIVMVAGEDPYAYKGIDDFASPHVRASGEGGCGNADKNSKKSGDGVTNPPKETS